MPMSKDILRPISGLFDVFRTPQRPSPAGGEGGTGAKAPPGAVSWGGAGGDGGAGSWGSVAGGVRGGVGSWGGAAGSMEDVMSKGKTLVPQVVG
jgi:hypothetical protein